MLSSCTRGCGEIGKHAAFRSPCPYGLGGSSPLSRIEIEVAVHPEYEVQAALDLARSGSSATRIAEPLGIPRTMIRDWLNGSPQGRTGRLGPARALPVADSKLSTNSLRITSISLVSTSATAVCPRILGVCTSYGSHWTPSTRRSFEMRWRASPRSAGGPQVSG